MRSARNVRPSLMALIIINIIIIIIIIALSKSKLIYQVNYE